MICDRSLSKLAPSPNFEPVMHARSWTLIALATLALLGSGCAMQISEAHFLKGRSSPLISDQIQRSNLELPLPETSGQSLKGWRLSHPAPRATLVYFYGGGGSLWNSARHLHDLAQQLEVDVVAFDVRGTGASGGENRFETLRADALRIHDLARRPGLPTLVMGYSLGSIPAIHLAAQRPVDGLAVVAGISSFDEARSNFDRQVPWYAKPFVRLQFDPVFQHRPQPVDELARVKAPTFILHGEADETLPVQCGDSLAAASPASWKRYLRLPEQGHANLPLLRGDSKSALDAWVQAARQSAQLAAR